MLRAPLFGTAVVRRLIASGLLVGSLALTGCGTPPELRDPPGGRPALAGHVERHTDRRSGHPYPHPAGPR